MDNVMRIWMGSGFHGVSQWFRGAFRTSPSVQEDRLDQVRASDSYLSPIVDSENLDVGYMRTLVMYVRCRAFVFIR